MNRFFKKSISILLAIITALTIPLSSTVFAVTDEEINSYNINGKEVNYKSVEDTGNDSALQYATDMYEYIWGRSYDGDFSAEDNMLRTMSDEELVLSSDSLRAYVDKAPLGAVLRISDAGSLHRTDNYGHSMIIVQKDSNGFTAFERTNERQEAYYTWDHFCSTYHCEFIKYIKYPVDAEESIYAQAGEDKYTIPERELYYTEPMLNGYDVCWVQNVLKKLGYEITVDGYYSNHTQQIVSDFQKAYNLEVTGRVDEATLEKLQKPVMKPDAPQLKLTSSDNISMGDIANVKWEAAAGATYYNLYVYNSKGVCVDSVENITGCNASVTLETPEIYTFKAKSVNSKYESELSEESEKIIVRSDITVTFVDSDGTVLNKQTIGYGGSAITPVSPKKTGYTFAGWDREYENLTSSLTVRATYTKKTYTVKFIDYDGSLISTQKVKYGNNATAPDISVPAGYSFLGWDRDLKSVTDNMTVRMVVIEDGSILPITINSCTAVRAEEHSGYTLTVELKNEADTRTNGRVVAALKTETGKFLTMTESSAFTITAGKTKTLEVFVPYESAAGLAEVYVVETYSSLIPISESVVSEINTENDWSGWIPEEEKPSEFFDQTEARTEYRYRTKLYTTSDKPTLAGWELYNTTTRWSDYGGWSGWSTGAIASNDYRQVESKTEQYVNGYNMVSYCTQSSKSPYYRQYRNYSIGGNYSGYGCRASYGEWGRSAFWSPSTLNAATKVPAGTYSSACSYGGYNRGNATGYAYGDYMWFTGSTSYGSSTYYRYRDRELLHTYHYSKWSDWSEWSTTSSTASDNVEVETRETKRYLVNDPTEDDTGELKTITGLLDTNFAGKQATLFIYKVDDASDYTNEYVGQTVIDEDGRYVFTFKLREEPSVKTGDFTVALGIEGANSLIFLNPLKAPKPEYTVNICDYDGTILDTQIVKQGESAILPTTSPQRKGYTFAGWDYSNASIYEDTNITALYVQNTYTVAYIDWTNELYELKTYNYGDPLLVPDMANEEGIVAVGWDAIIDGVQYVTDNMVITAKYETKEYKVNFYDYDGNVIDTQTVEYGNSAEAPSLASDDKYVFLSWDCSTDIENVKGNLEVHPEYRFVKTAEEPTANKASGVYSEEITVSFDCATENSLIYYSVNGGEEQEYTAPIEISQTSEIEFYSCSLGYNDSAKVKVYYIINNGENTEEFSYPVSIYSQDGKLLQFVIMKYGSALSEDLMNVTQTGYELEGYYKDTDYTQKWDNEIDTVTESTDLYIKWAPKSYSVKFVYEDGTVIDEQNVEYMNSAKAPENITTEEGYVFVGWDTDKYLSVTDDITVTAIIKAYEDVASITLDKTSLVMMKKMTYQLKPVILPDDGKTRTVIWSSDNEKIAVVDTDGKITAVNTGMATIKAYLPDSGVYAECTVKVIKNKYEEITLVSNADYTIVEGALFGVDNTSNTVDEISAQIDAETLVFKNSDGAILTGEDKVGTGCIIQLTDNTDNVLDEVVAVVTGDVTGDGYVNNKDVSKLARMLVEKDTFTMYEKMAADVNADAVVNNKDASMLSRYLVGKETL